MPDFHHLRRLRWIALVLTIQVPWHTFADTATAQHEPSGSRYSSAEQPNLVNASSTAIQACQKAHTSSPDDCELVELDGAPVITTRAIKARVPDRPHPLYLWRYTANETIIYLAGSVHILKPGFYPLPRQFEDAFAQSDRLVLEVDTQQISPAQMQSLTLKYASLPRGQTLGALLGDARFAALTRTVGAYGVDLTLFNHLKPNFVTQQLAVLALMSVGYNPDAGLEAHFRRKRGDRPILQLESVDFQLDLLFNAPLQTQVQLTEATLNQMPEFEQVTADLIAAWLSGDDASFIAATEAQSGETPALKAFSEALIERRNQSMATTLVGYLQQPGTYFVLIGAAHLIGDEGIPALLGKAGYPGRRYASDAVIDPP